MWLPTITCSFIFIPVECSTHWDTTTNELKHYPKEEIIMQVLKSISLALGLTALLGANSAAATAGPPAQTCDRRTNSAVILSDKLNINTATAEKFKAHYSALARKSGSDYRNIRKNTLISPPWTIAEIPVSKTDHIGKKNKDHALLLSKIAWCY